jgi:ABC-type lipoprotein export system ATPase subunit
LPSTDPAHADPVLSLEGVGRWFWRGELSRDELQRVRRHEIGFADRSGPLEPELTVLDHVAFPLIGTMPRAAAQRRTREKLDELGLDPACGGLTWAEMTDGERTLVSLAHAIVRRPRLLLVDDPTSNLGVHERERTMGLLARLASQEGMAVLMTAPDMAAHQVHVLSGGELLPVGPEPADENVLRFPDARA